MFILDYLPLAVTLVGGFMLIKLRAFFILRPLAVLRELKSTLKNKGTTRALCLALAGTLGVGNIVGVAVGLIVGGEGSVFWLLVSSIFATALKYSEATLSSDMACGDGGGMIPVLKNSFKRCGGALSVMYAFLALCLSLFMGGALQSVGAVGALSVSCGIDGGWLSYAFAFFSALILLLLKKKIKSLTLVIIPVVTSVYIALSLSVIIINSSKLPDILCLILKSATNFGAIGGGIIGFMVSNTVREGFSRGLLSNEAGAGTSSFSHSELFCTPSGAGLLGMCEVLFDTVILCPMTALAILSSVSDIGVFSSGAELVVSAFQSSLGTISSVTVAICILLFAFSTVACWFYYGRVCAHHLHFSQNLYTAIFMFSLIFGCMLGELLIVSFCDVLLLFLTLLTGAALIKNSDRIKYLSELSGFL